ncbi:hypothetical protein ACQSME_31215 [Streptomyces sp. 2-6]|uniref:hypothetical protein n=1 Tax=Streptomyces sp. 2-6 TaxID=2978333 RepID=UPI003D0F078B
MPVEALHGIGPRQAEVLHDYGSTPPACSPPSRRHRATPPRRQGRTPGRRPRPQLRPPPGRAPRPATPLSKGAGGAAVRCGPGVCFSVPRWRHLVGEGVGAAWTLCSYGARLAGAGRPCRWAAPTHRRSGGAVRPESAGRHCRTGGSAGGVVILAAGRPGCAAAAGRVRPQQRRLRRFQRGAGGGQGPAGVVEVDPQAAVAVE